MMKVRLKLSVFLFAALKLTSEFTGARPVAETPQVDRTPRLHHPPSTNLRVPQGQLASDEEYETDSEDEGPPLRRRPAPPTFPRSRSSAIQHRDSERLGRRTEDARDDGALRGASGIVADIAEHTFLALRGVGELGVLAYDSAEYWYQVAMWLAMYVLVHWIITHLTGWSFWI